MTGFKRIRLGKIHIMVRKSLPDKEWNKIEGTIQREEAENYSNEQLTEKILEIVEDHYND